jgi:HAD superfamily hydrolase (TIGR01509 family)
MPEMRGTLVFDYDGVIADTEPLHWKSWAALLSRYDIPFGWEEYCKIGLGVDDARICEALGGKAPSVGAAELLRHNPERKRMVREWSLTDGPIPQETINLLRTLSDYRIGLVTSSERSEVEPILRAVQIYDIFDGMVFGEDAAELKPSPAPYLLIARKLGVKSGIAFEDSVPGVESARSAGFNAVRIQDPRALAQIVTRYLCQASS